MPQTEPVLVPIKNLESVTRTVNKNKKRKINIRSGPGKRFTIIGKAYYGVVFETIKQTQGWANVRHESGLVGWVKRSLLWGF